MCPYKTYGFSHLFVCLHGPSLTSLLEGSLLEATTHISGEGRGQEQMLVGAEDSRQRFEEQLGSGATLPGDTTSTVK